MELFDLPPELFERVVGSLVGEVGPLYAAQYRLICKLFAVEIQKEILTRHPLVAYSSEERRLHGTAAHIAVSVDDARFEKLFAQHGGTIIGHEVFRRQKDPLPIIKHLKDLTEAVLCLKGPAANELRKQYTIDICTALSCVFWKQLRWRLFLRDYSEIRIPSIEDDLPAALAATGNIKLLLDLNSTKADHLIADCSCLPTPLEAAAACGQVEVVQMISDYIIQKPKVKSLSSDEAVFCLRSALSSAIRKSQKHTTDVLFDHFCETRKMFIRTIRMFRECVRHQDTGLIRRVLSISDPSTTTLTPNEMHNLFQDGSCSILRALIRDNFIDPNHFADTMPLTLAMHNHRYDLARVLLQCGAQVDGVPKTGKSVTALWHAAREGFVGYGANNLPGVRFLLQHGADPDIHGDWRSPLRAAENSWPDVYFLLQQAKDFGMEIALHPDTWRQYEQLESSRRPVSL